jgi:hypothetical protein
MESPRSPERNEKPAFVYHGSVTGDITEFEPRRRYVPGGADVPPRVYAAPNPAFAAAHSFPWSSDEGIDLSIESGQVVLQIPKELESRLQQPVFIYTLPGEPFELTSEETTGETMHAEEPVIPKTVFHFTSVREAIEHFGGRVEIF